MKSFYYIAAVLLTSCSSTRNFSTTVEDDIYYVPGRKALVVEEVENLTGQAVSEARTAVSAPAPAKKPGNTANVTATPDLPALTSYAQEQFDANEYVNETVYENTGYWIGGYKGNESDLQEIQHIINMYPNGFAYFNVNGQDIAMNLSFDPDWNVYTYEGRYWWFPSYTNINLYSSLLFGTYPRHIWTVMWDNPRFDSWAFNSGFNSGFNFGISAGRPGWSIGVNWGWYDPWYRPWYGGWYDPWYRPWHGGWYDPWYHPGHHHHPNYGGGIPSHRPQPHLSGNRPNYGGGVSGIRPAIRPSSGNRPSTTTNRPNTPQRPATGNMVRPGTNTPNGRPATTPRPNTPGIVRPGTSTRPNNGTVTRPTTTPRPNTTPAPARSNYTRPATRPANGNTTKSYTRPTTNYRRPTYNSNSVKRSIPTPNSSNYSAPVRNNTGGGNVSRPSTPTRPTRR